MLSMYSIILESTIKWIKDSGFSVCVFYSTYLPCCQGLSNIKHDTLLPLILHLLHLVWLREKCLVVYVHRHAQFLSFIIDNAYRTFL